MFVRPDDDAQPNGAEVSEYTGTGLSYGPKNAPIGTRLDSFTVDEPCHVVAGPGMRAPAISI